MGYLLHFCEPDVSTKGTDIRYAESLKATTANLRRFLMSFGAFRVYDSITPLCVEKKIEVCKQDAAKACVRNNGKTRKSVIREQHAEIFGGALGGHRGAPS